MNDAAVERESTLGRVEDCRQGPMDGRLRGIEVYRDRVMRMGCGRGRGRRDEEAGEHGIRGETDVNRLPAENALHVFSVSTVLLPENSSRREFPGESQSFACSGHRRVQRGVAENNVGARTVS